MRNIRIFNFLKYIGSAFIMPLKLLQDQNKLLFGVIYVSVFGGLILASIEGYLVYVVGYTLIFTIIGFSFIMYIVVSYRQMMTEPRNLQKEMEQELGMDIDGNRPVAMHTFHRITFGDHQK